MAIIPTGDTQDKGKRVGGKGVPEFKNPLGIPPVAYMNQEPMTGIRRTMTLDNGARVAAQYEVDHGVYQRPPVKPVEYAFGNIKKSTMQTGVAGYNQREIPFTESPDDMDQQQFMMAMAQELDPKARQVLTKATSTGQQFFLNTPSPGTQLEYPIQSHQSVDNMLATAQATKAKKQRK